MPVTDLLPNALFDTADAILASAWRGLSRCPDTAKIKTGVVHGHVDADCCDILTVHLTNYGPTAKAQANEQRAASPSGVPPWSEGNWTVTLWESCYPTVTRQGDRFILPSLAEQHEANRVLHQHASAMYSNVLDDYRLRQLLLNPKQCPRFTFGPLLPLGPNGGCAGWSFTVTGSLDS